ncbi:AdoMet_MTases domain containing protein [Burkholderiaceae bacterium]
MNFWDQNFSAPGYKYGLHPNAFMADQTLQLSVPSDVLVPGDGEGRNGVWLAQQGHRVTAVDISAVGLSKAQALATERGVSITTVHADLADWTPEPNSADALVLIYLHLTPALRASAHQRMLKALRPRGLLIIEAFHPLQLGHSSGGPKDSAMLYTLDMLRQDFAGLNERLAYEGHTVLEEGPGHQGPAHVTRWVAQRA